MGYFDEDDDNRKENSVKIQPKKDNQIKLYNIKDLLAIILVVLLLVGTIIFAKIIYTYKMSVFDPIADIKTTIMNIEEMFVACATGFIIISIVVRDDPHKVHNWVTAALIFSLLMTISLLVSKVYLDIKYDANAFVDFYQSGVYEKQIGEISLDEFVEESKEGYKNFTTKCNINLMINMIIIGIVIRFFRRTNEIILKQEKIRAHDAALFDEEDNVKI